jgi:DNA-binding transcriptional MerR regulator
VAPHTARYGIDTLADLGGVSRRTVRYYIQEGLIPAPHGLGRGDHYGAEHLAALLRVRREQEAGRSLEQIRQPPDRSPSRNVAPVIPPAAMTEWRRIALAPGVELHVSSKTRLPTAAALHSLADWCRAHLRGGEGDHAD